MPLKSKPMTSPAPKMRDLVHVPMPKPMAQLSHHGANLGKFLHPKKGQ